MKRILFPAAFATALVIVLSGSPAMAQQTPAPAPTQDTQPPAPIVRTHHAHNAHHEAMKLSRELNLSADQTTKIEPILADAQQKTEALEANTSLSDQERKQQRHAIRKDTRGQLDAVLTPDQQAQMKTLHHGHKGRNMQPLTPPATPPQAA